MSSNQRSKKSAVPSDGLKMAGQETKKSLLSNVPPVIVIKSYDSNTGSRDQDSVLESCRPKEREDGPSESWSSVLREFKGIKGASPSMSAIDEKDNDGERTKNQESKGKSIKKGKKVVQTSSGKADDKTAEDSDVHDTQHKSLKDCFRSCVSNPGDLSILKEWMLPYIESDIINIVGFKLAAKDETLMDLLEKHYVQSTITIDQKFNIAEKATKMNSDKTEMHKQFLDDLKETNRSLDYWEGRMDQLLIADQTQMSDTIKRTLHYSEVNFDNILQLKEDVGTITAQQDQAAATLQQMIEQFKNTMNRFETTYSGMLQQTRSTALQDTRSISRDSIGSSKRESRYHTKVPSSSSSIRPKLTFDDIKTTVEAMPHTKMPLVDLLINLGCPATLIKKIPDKRESKEMVYKKALKWTSMEDVNRYWSVVMARFDKD